MMKLPLYLLVLIVIVPAPAIGLELNVFFIENADNNCPPIAWDVVFNQCAAAECGTEEYDQVEKRRNESGSGFCGGFYVPQCLAADPGEYLRVCEVTGCASKGKGFTIYHEFEHVGHYYKLRNKSCAVKECGEQSRVPTSFSSCRSRLHGIDAGALISAMNSGSDLDRAMASLAIAVSESKYITSEVYQAIESNLNKVDEQKPSVVDTIDKVRKFISAETSEISVDVVNGLFNNAGYPNVESFALTQWMDQLGGQSEPGGTSNMVFFSAAINEPAGYAPGDGIDSITGESKGQCIEPSAESSDITTYPDDPPKDLIFSLEKIDSYESLLDAMNVNVKASVTYGLGSGKANLDFSKEIKSSENSTYLLAKVRVLYEEQAGAWKGIKPEWRDILNKGTAGRKQFFAGCGDIYARGVRKGSEFFAIYQIEARDRSEKERVQASFSGGYSGVFSASADFSRAIDRVYRFSNVRSKILSVGYPGGKVGNSAEEIVNYALTFSDNVKYKNAKSLVATTGKYTDFANFPPGNPFVDGAQLAYINSAEKDFQWLLSRISIYSAAKDHESAYDFGDHSLGDISSVENEVNKLLAQTGAAAAKCYAEKSECNSYKSVNRSLVWAPQLKKVDYVVGGCSNKGSRFGNLNGGCLDTNSGTTWGAVSPSYWSYEGAKGYCSTLAENQTKGWSLPSFYDTAQLSGPDGAVQGFKDGTLIDDWFWVTDGSVEKKPIRVNLKTGASNTEQNPEMKFKVICKQGV